MQTSTTTIVPAPAIVPGPVKAKAKHAPTDLFRQNPLACRLMDAVGPLVLDNGDFTLRDGVFDIDVYRAMLPICSEFTVADAHQAFMAVFASTPRLCSMGSNSDRAARYFIGSMLQDFSVVAAPSTPDCVSALAGQMALSDPFDKDEPELTDTQRWLGAANLAFGIWALRAGKFEGGQTFGSAGNGTRRDSWTYRIAKATGRLDRWYPPKKGAAR